MKSGATAFGLVALCLTSLLHVSAAAQGGPQGEPQFRFDQMVASVKDGNGVLVSNLRAKDFVIEENGEKQSVVSFGTSVESPISLGILIDVNADMAKYLGSAKGAVTQLVLASILSARDEYALFTFDSDLKVLQDFGPFKGEDWPINKDTKFPEHKLVKALQAKGPTTALYNIVADTVSAMQKAKHQRRALVVFTDANDREAGAIGALKRATAQYGVTLYAIGFSGTLPATKEAENKATMNMNNMNRNAGSLRDVGLTDVASGLSSNRGGGGFGGGGFGGGGMGGMGGGGMGGMGMGGTGMGGMGMGGMQQPYGNNQQFGQPYGNNQQFGQPYGNNQQFGQPYGNQQFGMNQPFGTQPFGNNMPQMPDRPSYGTNRRSVMLDNLVSAGSGRAATVDLSIFGTDAGASENAQRVLGMAKNISEDLRGQYILGYYTSSPASFAERKLVVKAVGTEAEKFTVSIEPPKPPEPIVAPSAKPAEKAPDAKAADKGKTAEKQDNKKEKK